MVTARLLPFLHVNDFQWISAAVPPHRQIASGLVLRWPRRFWAISPGAIFAAAAGGFCGRLPKFRHLPPGDFEVSTFATRLCVGRKWFCCLHAGVLLASLLLPLLTPVQPPIHDDNLLFIIIILISSLNHWHPLCFTLPISYNTLFSHEVTWRCDLMTFFKLRSPLSNQPCGGGRPSSGFYRGCHVITVPRMWRASLKPKLSWITGVGSSSKCMAAAWPARGLWVGNTGEFVIFW